MIIYYMRQVRPLLAQRQSVLHEMLLRKILSMPFISLHHISRSWTILFLLYAYGTLHFGFAVPSVFGFNDRSIIALHLYSTPVAWKAFAMLVWIGASLLLFAKRAPRGSRPTVISEFLTRMAWLLGILTTVWFGCLMSPVWKSIPAGFALAPNWPDYKGAISAIATWATALIGAKGLLFDKRAVSLSGLRVPSLGIGPMLMCLVVFVAAIALAELWTGLAYSSEHRGVYIASRASSTLFNPNVLGFWAGDVPPISVAL